MNKAAVKERPIIISSRLIPAVLDGTKTQTRRPLKPQPIPNGDNCFGWYPYPITSKSLHYANEAHLKRGLLNDFSIYGKPGDRLWVRESFRTVAQGEIVGEQAGYIRYGVYYPADKTTIWQPNPTKTWVYGNEGIIDAGNMSKIKPSIHMPYRYSRIKLEITDVRIEKLQNISGEDALSEGVVNKPSEETWAKLNNEVRYSYYQAALAEFRLLWNELYGPDAWEKNEWVWVYDYKLIEVRHEKQTD